MQLSGQGQTDFITHHRRGVAVGAQGDLACLFRAENEKAVSAKVSDHFDRGIQYAFAVGPRLKVFGSLIQLMRGDDLRDGPVTCH